MFQRKSECSQELFTAEMQVIWQVRVSEWGVGCKTKENVSKKIIILEEKMARVLERIAHHDEQLAHQPCPTHLIESKVLPFMDYIDEQMQQLKEGVVNEESVERIVRDLASNEHRTPCTHSTPSERSFAKQIQDVNQALGKEIQHLYDLVRQNIQSQRDLLEEWQTSKRPTYKDSEAEMQLKRELTRIARDSFTRNSIKASPDRLPSHRKQRESAVYKSTANEAYRTTFESRRDKENLSPAEKRVSEYSRSKEKRPFKRASEYCIT